MAARDANRRFESLIAQADEPWRMLAVCLIGQALDDISTRGGDVQRDAEACEWAEDAVAWIEGAPADMPSFLACALARISPTLLRTEAESRMALRWPQAAFRPADYTQLAMPLLYAATEATVAA